MILGAAIRGLFFIGVICWYSTGVIRVINDYFRREFKLYIDDELRNIDILKKHPANERNQFVMNNIDDNEQCHANAIEPNGNSDIKQPACSALKIDDVNHEILIKNNDNAISSAAASSNDDDDLENHQLQHKIRQIFDMPKTQYKNDDEVSGDDNENGNYREMQCRHRNHVAYGPTTVLQCHSWNGKGNGIGAENNNNDDRKFIDLKMEQSRLCLMNNNCCDGDMNVDNGYGVVGNRGVCEHYGFEVFIKHFLLKSSQNVL